MRWIVVVATLCVSACTNNNSSGTGRGSVACNGWQDAICDYAVGCGAMTRQNCTAQYQAVTCKSDDTASQCATEFRQSSCGRAPASCDIDGIADPGPAARACDQLIQGYCQRSVMCGVSDTQEACLATPTVQGIDCGKAIAFRLAFEECFQAVETLDCSLLQLPSVCNNVIILRS
jgi:hypothetical protein